MDQEECRCQCWVPVPYILLIKLQHRRVYGKRNSLIHDASPHLLYGALKLSHDQEREVLGYALELWS
jgi:hypothetical protein